MHSEIEKILDYINNGENNQDIKKRKDKVIENYYPYISFQGKGRNFTIKPTSFLKELSISYKMYNQNNKRTKSTPIPILKIDNALVRGSIFKDSIELLTYIGQEQASIPKKFIYYYRVYNKIPPIDNFLNIDLSKFNKTNIQTLISNEANFVSEKYSTVEVTYYADNNKEFYTFLDVPSYAMYRLINIYLRIANDFIFQINKAIHKKRKNHNISEEDFNKIKTKYLNQMMQKSNGNYQEDYKKAYNAQIYNKIKNFYEKHLTSIFFKKQCYINKEIANQKASNTTNIDYFYNNSAYILTADIPSFKKTSISIIEKIETSKKSEKTFIQYFMQQFPAKIKQKIFNRFVVADKIYQDIGFYNNKYKNLIDLNLQDLYQELFYFRNQYDIDYSLFEDVEIKNFKMILYDFISNQNDKHIVDLNIFKQRDKYNIIKLIKKGELV